MDHSLIDLKCQYCKERCFLPVFETWLHAPATLEAAAAFISRNVGLVATCNRGRSVERDLMGVEFETMLTSEQRGAIMDLIMATQMG